MRHHFHLLVLASAALCSLSAACGPSGGVASAGSLPAAAAVVADATLPPPSEISPIAKTTIDDHAIKVAFDALDTAASAADTILLFKPTFAGTDNAKRMANGLIGARTWLNIASKAQRAGQATSYQAALEQASAALAGASAALLSAKAN